jgi:hypothetical protein
MSILALTSDTLVGTAGAGQIEYNGQFFGTDSAGSRAQLQRLVRATAVASTSGTAIDFTSLPAWVKKITVMFAGISTNGTSSIQVQLGTGSTTYTTTGYVGSTARFSASALTSTSFTTGFGFNNSVSTALISGSITITNLTSNTWSSSGSGVSADSGFLVFVTGGSIALGAALTAVRITTVNGTDTFDAGTVNIIYEG